jgi:hypothetical protein
MKSFKLEKGGSAKQQAQQVGILLIVLGLVIGLLWYLPAGAFMIVLGIVLFLGGTFASS